MAEAQIQAYNTPTQQQSELGIEIMYIDDQLRNMGNENEPERAILIARRQALYAQVTPIVMNQAQIEAYNRQVAEETQCIMEIININNQLSNMDNENEPDRAVLIERRKGLCSEVNLIQMLLRKCHINFRILHPSCFAG